MKLLSPSSASLSLSLSRSSTLFMKRESRGKPNWGKERERERETGLGAIDGSASGKRKMQSWEREELLRKKSFTRDAVTTFNEIHSSLSRNLSLSLFFFSPVHSFSLFYLSLILCFSHSLLLTIYLILNSYKRDKERERERERERKTGSHVHVRCRVRKLQRDDDQDGQQWNLIWQLFVAYSQWNADGFTFLPFSLFCVARLTGTEERIGYSD
jgi:hypothetical protein